jgi:hypothetical protein
LHIESCTRPHRKSTNLREGCPYINNYFPSTIPHIFIGGERFPFFFLPDKIIPGGIPHEADYQAGSKFRGKPVNLIFPIRDFDFLRQTTN